MATPALVLVHGGMHAADCWERTVDEVARQAPDLRVLAVDLPGHGHKPGDLATLSITDCIDSVVADIDNAEFDEVVLVAHSLGGATIPGVAAKLGAARVREMVFAAALVPPQGATPFESLPGPLCKIAQFAARKGTPFELPKAAASWGFCNGMTREQRSWTMARQHRESASVMHDIVDRTGMPTEIPRTWILTTKDRVVKAGGTQRVGMAALGGVQTVIPIDTCHNLMVSEPAQTAQILIGRCRQWA